MNSFKRIVLAISTIVFCHIGASEQQITQYSEPTPLFLPDGGYTQLHKLASVKYPESREALAKAVGILENDPLLHKIPDYENRLPLHEAATTGKSKFLEWLLKAEESDVNARD